MRLVRFLPRLTKFPFSYPPRLPRLALPPPPPPVWRMFMHDHAHRGVADTLANVIYFGSRDHKIYALRRNGSLKWAYETGKAIDYASPVVDENGVIYIGSRDFYLYALNPDGTLKWRYYAGDAIKFSAAIDEETGVIYVGSYAAYIHAINPDGSEKWKYSTSFAVTSSVTLHEYIYTCDYMAKVYCLRADGTLKWRYSTSWYIYLSTPAIDVAHECIYVGDRNAYLYAINYDGSTRWRGLVTADIYSSPSLDYLGNIYFSDYNGYVLCVDFYPNLLWFFKVGPIMSSAAVSKQIYVGSEDYKLYAFDYEGSLQWSFMTGLWIYASPSVDKEEMVFIGSDDNKMYALKDGSLQWAFMTGDEINSSAAIV